MIFQWIERFLSRDTNVWVQFVKYGIGGAIATVTHIFVFHLVAWRLFPALQPDDWAVRLFRLLVVSRDDARRARNSMYSNAAGFIISNFVAYLINILWVFQRGRYSWIAELLFFYLVSGVSVAIGTVIMGWLIRHHGIRTTYAFISNIVTAMLINYVLRKYVIFQG